MSLDIEKIYYLDYWRNKEIGILPDENVEKAQKYLSELIDEGLLYIPLPEEELVFLKVNDLKDILRNNKMKISGKKQELIDRIIENFSPRELSKNVVSLYHLTNQGKHELKYKKVFVTNKVRNYGFNEREIEEMRDNLFNININFCDNDIFWGLLNNRTLHSQLNGEWKLFRDTKKYMVDILFEEKKYFNVLEQGCIVMYLDLSGMEDNGNIKNLNEISVDYDLVNKIRIAKENDSDNSEEGFRIIFECSVQLAQVPFSYYSVEDAYHIVCNLLDGDLLTKAQQGFSVNHSFNKKEEVKSKGFLSKILRKKS